MKTDKQHGEAIDTLKAKITALRTALVNDRAAFADIEDTGCSSQDHFSLRDRKKHRECPQVGARRRIDTLDAILREAPAAAVGPSDVLAEARKALQDIRDLGGLGTAAQIARRYLEGHPLGSPVGPPETACGRCGFPLSPCHQGAPESVEPREARAWCDECGIFVKASGHGHFPARRTDPA